MRKMLVLALLLVVAQPARAEWRTGYGGAAGLIEGGPATSVLLDLNPGPMSHMHLRPRGQVWLPEHGEGVQELGLDALYHLLPCHVTSAYVGLGVGAEWVGRAERPCPDCGTPAAQREPPPAPKPCDPPIGVGIVGVRFLPGSSVDLGLEARGTLTTGRPRGGFFLVAVLHEPRQVVVAKRGRSADEVTRRGRGDGVEHHHHGRRR